MSAKDYIEQYESINCHINHLIDERSRWFAMATKTSPTLSDMPKGGEQPNKIQTAIDNIAEIDEEINQCIDKLVKIKAAAMLKGIIIKGNKHKWKTAKQHS